MDPATLSLLGTLGSGLFGFLTGNKKQEMPREQRALMESQRNLTNTENALQQLLLQRKRSQDPLFRALQQMAFSRLPVFAKQGIGFDASQPVGVPTPGNTTSRTSGGNPITGRAVDRNEFDAMRWGL